jgi:mannose/fructose/N-acetylgalactosamine-specific phosphotransferase system component IIB
MSVELFRIDDRLIHGQVVVGWGQPLAIEFISLVDDEVAASAWERDLYRMGVPAAVELLFDSLDSAVARLAGYVSDSRRGIVLTGDVETMQLLASRSGLVRRVNLGGLHYRPGRVERLRYVFLSSDDEEHLRVMQGAGLEVSAQDVPGATPVPLAALLANQGGA